MFCFTCFIILLLQVSQAFADLAVEFGVVRSVKHIESVALANFVCEQRRDCASGAAICAECRCQSGVHHHVQSTVHH
jgi:hypothetical protein